MKNEVVNILMEKVRKILKSKQIPFEEYNEGNITFFCLLKNDLSRTKVMCKFSDVGHCFTNGIPPIIFTSHLYRVTFDYNIDESLCDIISSFGNWDYEINGMRIVTIPNRDTH